MDAGAWQVVQSFISSVGFPIVAFAAMFWMMNSTIKELTTTISANTQAVAKLMAYLETKEG